MKSRASALPFLARGRQLACFRCLWSVQYIAGERVSLGDMSRVMKNAPGCVQQSGAFAIEERHNGFRSAEKVRLEARATSRNGWESAETRSWKTENFPCQRLDIPDGMCYFFADQMVNKNLSTY